MGTNNPSSFNNILATQQLVALSSDILVVFLMEASRHWYLARLLISWSSRKAHCGRHSLGFKHDLSVKLESFHRIPLQLNGLFFLMHSLHRRSLFFFWHRSHISCPHRAMHSKRSTSSNSIAPTRWIEQFKSSKPYNWYSSNRIRSISASH